MASKCIFVLLSVNVASGSDTKYPKKHEKIDLKVKGPYHTCMHTITCSDVILQWTYLKSGPTCVIWTSICMEHLAVKDTVHNLRHPRHQPAMANQLCPDIILLYKNAIGRTRKQDVASMQPCSFKMSTLHYFMLPIAISQIIWIFQWAYPQLRHTNPMGDREPQPEIHLPRHFGHICLNNGPIFII